MVDLKFDNPKNHLGPQTSPQLAKYVYCYLLLGYDLGARSEQQDKPMMLQVCLSLCNFVFNHMNE